MYHYVRNTKRTAFPKMHARKLGEFDFQLNYLKSNFAMGSLHDLAIGRHEIVLLSFDDGLKDHYRNAFPVLKKKGFSALFFVSSLPLVRSVLLDVHKIQLLLASQPHEDLFRLFIDHLGRRRFREYEDSGKLESDPSRYDNQNVKLFKRLLQRDLELPLRSELLGGIFKHFFPGEEERIARDFYMSITELREMKDAGMVIGNHTNSHHWLGHLRLAEAKSEILECEAILFEEGLMDENLKAIAYPYGNSSNDIESYLRASNYKFAFTTEPYRWNPSEFEPMRIPRLDTNDVPFV